MPAPAALELKAFVPAKDFAQSKRFYADLGFTQRSEGGGVAYFACGSCAFLLQDYYVQEFAENSVMHLLVADVQAWHRHVVDSGLAKRYGVNVTAVAEQPTEAAAKQADKARFDAVVKRDVAAGTGA